MRDRREGWNDGDDRYGDDDDDRSPILDRLVAGVDWLVGLVRVAWNLVLYAGVPAALMLAFSTAERLDVVAPLSDAALRQRLGPLGLLLGVIAAVITNYTFTLLGRPFGLGKFLVTAVVIAVAVFPFLAATNHLTLGLTPDQFAVVLSYAYLGLKVAVGVLIGATVSWMLVSHAVATEPPRRR